MSGIARRAAGVAAHAAIAAVAYWLAFWLAADFAAPGDRVRLFARTLPVLLALRAAAFGAFRVSEGLWRYTSVGDLVGLAAAVTAGSSAFAAVALPVWGPELRASVLVLDWILTFALVGGARLGVRSLRERGPGPAGRRALVVGGGDAGEMLVREIRRNPGLAYRVVGIADDDARKRSRRIHGVAVAGSIEGIPELCRALAAEEILIAIPTASEAQRRRMMERCRESGVPVKTVPSLGELVHGSGIASLRPVAPEDLLQRRPVEVDSAGLRAEMRGRRVLVTGAGGSIGSELCRQVAAFGPETLVLYERAESALYFVDLELRRGHPGLRVVPVVGDILDEARLGDVVGAHAPEIVYHAAAYKHVPLMEENPLEAIRNNVFGTEAVARAAVRSGIRRLVLISTDKAVRPVGIMGMTKRVAEDLLLAMGGGPTTFAAVRFGNVLGSEGSVLPLFQWQLARGGPVTVTDPDASRYFMLISEAAQLVLQAGAMARGGEVFLLDMGEPVGIMTLAENLVRLSGLEPGRDVAIETVGLRPGERLREELVGEAEELAASGHERIFVLRDRAVDAAAFREDLETLRRLVAARDTEGAVARLKAMAGRTAR